MLPRPRRCAGVIYGVINDRTQFDVHGVPRGCLPRITPDVLAGYDDRVGRLIVTKDCTVDALLRTSLGILPSTTVITTVVYRPKHTDARSSFRNASQLVTIAVYLSWPAFKAAAYLAMAFSTYPVGHSLYLRDDA